MPNYLALYEALDLKLPKFVSLPHILATHGNKKLSKRDGAKSVTDYRDEGVLPEAMFNYLACLGWNDGTEQEIYTRDEILEKFSIDRIQSSGAHFDEVKLLWTNGQWLRKLADEQGIDALMTRCDDFWPATAANYPAAYRHDVLAIIYDRLKTLADLRTMTTYFFEDPTVDLDLIHNNKFLKKLSEAELASLCQTVFNKLETSACWDSDAPADAIQAELNSLLAETGKKPAELFSLIRIALSYAPFSPALNLTMAVLGRERVLARLSTAHTALVNG